MSYKITVDFMSAVGGYTYKSLTIEHERDFRLISDGLDVLLQEIHHLHYHRTNKNIVPKIIAQAFSEIRVINCFTHVHISSWYVIAEVAVNIHGPMGRYNEERGGGAVHACQCSIKPCQLGAANVMKGIRVVL